MTPGRTLWSRGQKVDNYANVATGERAGSGECVMCDDGPGDMFISCVTWNTLYSYLMAHGGPCGDHNLSEYMSQTICTI